MNKTAKFSLFFLFLGIIILIIPPIQPAPLSIENSSWDGSSQFKKLLEEYLIVTDTTIPLRLIGDVKVDVIVVIGGNLPYFSEESNFLRQFVEKGGNVILFEDHGYARALTSSFGISLQGTIIDQEIHARNPYQPIVNQDNVEISKFSFTSCSVVFNTAVRVQRTRFITNSSYYPLFRPTGRLWEDKNSDGIFYKESEALNNESCYLGGILTFNNSNGKFVVVGDSAMPTNDMIDKEDNRIWLTDLVLMLTTNGAKTVLFDESRKLWLPPTGKAAIGTLSVLLMGLFHSPLIAIITIIIIGGVIGIKNDDQLIRFVKDIRISSPIEEKPIAAFLQSEEEEEIGKITKSDIYSDLYRTLLADEIRQIASKLTIEEKMDYESLLKRRRIDLNLYQSLIYQLKKYRKI
ncbi:MAG: DUF4350 domain-containing protein [Candidatus Hodarchaeales archaeon]